MPPTFLQLIDAVVCSLLFSKVDKVALPTLDLRFWALLQVLCQVFAQQIKFAPLALVGLTPTHVLVVVQRLACL